MAITVAELEATISMEASKFNAGVESIKSKLGEIESGMSHLNTKGVAMGTALGNIGAQLVGKAFNFFKGMSKDAIEVSTYNERVKLSLDAINAEQLKQNNGKSEWIKVATKQVQVAGHLAAVTALTSKELKHQQVVANQASEAQSHLMQKQIALEKQAYIAAGGVPKSKKGDPKLYEFKLQGASANVISLTKDIADMNAKIAAGQNIGNGGSPKWISGYSKIVPIMKEIRHDMLTDTQIAEQAAKQTKQVITNLELMAINSPFNKQNLVDAFTTLRTFGNYSNDAALKITQGMTDTAAVRGLSGDALSRMSNSLSKLHQFGRLYLADAKQLGTTLPGFFDKLRDKLNVDSPTLLKMFRKGMITEDVVSPILNDIFTEYKGQADKFSKSLPGLIESLGDVYKVTLGNFSGPILDAFKPIMDKIVGIFTKPEVQAKITAAGEKIGKWLGNGLDSVIKIFDSVSKAVGEGGLNLGSVFKGLSDLVNSNNSPAWMIPLSGIFSFIATNGQTIVTAIQGIGVGLGVITAASTALKVMETFAAIIGGLLSPIGLLGVALGALYFAYRTNFGGIADTLNNFWAQAKPIVDGLLSGKINLKDLIVPFDSTGLAQPILDFVTGIPKTLMDAVAALNKDGVGAAFKVLWNGFGLKGLDVVNAVSEFVGTVSQDVRDNASKIATAFAEWGTSALDWLNLGIDDIQNKITAPDGLIENIGAALGNAVGALERVVQPWLKIMTGKVLTPDEATMVEKVTAFVNRIGSTINNLGDLVKAVGITFSNGFWTSAGEDVSKGVGLFFEAISKEFTLDKLKAALLKGIGGELSIENIVFGKKGGEKNFLDSKIGSLFAPLPKSETQESFWANFFNLPTAPVNVKIPINATADIQRMIDQGVGEGLIKQYMVANGIRKIGDSYFFDMNGLGATVSQSNALNVSIPIATKAVLNQDQSTTTGPVNPGALLQGFVEKALPGIPLTSQGAYQYSSETVSLSVPMNVTPTITQAPTVLNGAAFSGDVGGVHAAIFHSVFPESTVTVSNGTGTLPNIALSLPIGVTASIVAGKEGTTNVLDTIAANAGLTKGADNTYSLANAASIDVKVPINISVGSGTAEAIAGGATGAATDNGVGAAIGKFFTSASLTKTDTGYASPNPVDISIPINIKPISVANGNEGDQNTISPLISTITGSISTPASIKAISDSLVGVYGPAMALFVTNTKLSSKEGNLSYTVGQLIISSVKLGIDTGMPAVSKAFDAITDKIKDLKDVQVPALQTKMATFSAALNSVVAPNFDTFRTGALSEMNSALSYQLKLIDSLKTSFLEYGRTVAGFNPPPTLGGGAPSGTTAPSDGRTRESFADSQVRTERNISFTIPVHMDGEVIANKTYKVINSKLVEEQRRY